MIVADGQSFLQSDFWLGIIPQPSEKINYLEIGVHSGFNLLSVEKLYANHPESKLFAIDPWCDYEDYPEYKGQMDNTYANFCRNIKTFNVEHKVNVIKGYSNVEVPKLEDSFFDIIFIDGNHEPEYALEDAVLSFRKLKVGGYLIFDDWNFGGPDGTTRGIQGFMSAYHKRIKVLETKWTTWGLAQVFIQKLR